MKIFLSLQTKITSKTSSKKLQKFVEGEGSKIDGLPREGIVFYDKETGQQYTKFVSPEFLMRFHS